MIEIRKAKDDDIIEISKIYDKIHTKEENGEVSIGWIRQVYPTKLTAQKALEKGELFVMVDNNKIVASAKINQEQVDEYKYAKWQYHADNSEVMVLHTLTVDPDRSGNGYGKKFIEFYEKYALESNCKYLRIDTNEKNVIARKMYKKLGYTEVGIIPCVFNGIPNVNLVCLEKYLGK